MLLKIHNRGRLAPIVLALCLSLGAIAGASAQQDPQHPDPSANGPDPQVTALRDQVTALTQQVNILLGEVNNDKSAMATLVAQDGAFATDIQNGQAQTAALQAQLMLSQQQAQQDAATTQLLQAQFENLIQQNQANAQEFRGDIDGLQQQTQSLVDNSNSVSGQIATLTDSVNAISTSATADHEQLQALSAQNAADHPADQASTPSANEAIATLQQQVVALADKDGGLVDLISTTREQVASLGQTVDGIAASTAADHAQLEALNARQSTENGAEKQIENPIGQPEAPNAPATPQAPAPGDQTTALQDQMFAVTDRLTQVLGEQVQRIDTLEEAITKPKKTPFVVTDEGGNVVFAVNDNSVSVGSGSDKIDLSVTNGTAAIVMGSQGSNISLQADADGPHLFMAGSGQSFAAGSDQGAMSVTVSQGKNTVGLVAGGDSASVNVNEASRSASVGGADATFGFAASVNGSRVAALGDKGNGTYSLRVYQAGAVQPVIQAGALNDGQPGVIVGNGTDQFARIEGKDGAGVLTAYAAGKETVVVSAAGDSKGLSVLDPGGSEVVFAGASGDGDPNVRISKENNILATLSTSITDPSAGAIFAFHGNDRQVVLDAGGAAGLRIFAGEDNVLSAYAATDGLPGISLSHGAVPVVQIGPSGDDPGTGSLSLLQDGQPSVAAGNLGNGVVGLQVLQASGKPTIDLSVDGGAPGLSFNTGDTLRAFIGASGDGNPSVDLFSDSGLLAELSKEGEAGLLTVYNAGARALTVGSTKEKPNPSFRAYSGDETTFAAGSKPGGGGAVQTFGGGSQIGAGLEAGASGTGIVYVESAGQIVAALNSIDRPGQGLVEVRTNGSTVAALQQGSNGGGNISLTDNGGQNVFSAGYDGGDGPGSVCVNHKGIKCLGVGLTGMEGFH